MVGGERQGGGGASSQAIFLECFGTREHSSACVYWLQCGGWPSSQVMVFVARVGLADSFCRSLMQPVQPPAPSAPPASEGRKGRQMGKKLKAIWKALGGHGGSGVILA